MTSSSRPQTSHPGSLARSSAASRQRLGYAQRFWNSRRLLGSLMLARQEAPQLEAQCIPGELRFGHPEPVGDG
eukprot:13874198-Alexandrium_andersonii.AAC.1